LSFKILIDSKEFKDNLKKDLLSAKKKIHIQTLSFESDSVGDFLSEILIQKKDIEKKVITDYVYSNYILNDRFIYFPKNLIDKSLRRLKKDTKMMYERLKKEGVLLKHVNKPGFLFLGFAARNHKKIIIIDNEIAYIGGINFSEHNFDWHDLMVRIENIDIAKFLEQDFDKTWDGENQLINKQFEGVDILIMDGKNNEKLFAKIFNIIDKAKKSIFIESPYFSFPFYEPLERAVKRGVRVFMIVPETNNWLLYDKYTNWEIQKSKIKRVFYPNRMNHLKAILIDNETLVLGSANFDYCSTKMHQEILAVFNDPNIIKDFKEKIEKPDTAMSIDSKEVKVYKSRPFAVLQMKGALIALEYLYRKFHRD